MAITITHPTAAIEPGDGDPNKIQPEDWNMNHDVTGTVEVANGGTGATTAADARTNLGLGTIATQNSNSVSITGGSLSGVTITSLDANTTFQDNADPTKQMQFQLSGITGGQTRVLTSPDFDGTIATLSGTESLTNKVTVDTTSLEVTNLKAKDGTAAGSIADATGVVTLASSVLTTVDINGGTIDGVTIGASVAPTVTNLGSVATCDINGGTIDGTTQASGTINGPIAAGGTWTAAATWTLPAHTLGGTVTSNNQSFSGTIANLGSVTTCDINGGTIDGTTIGGASAAAGTFTTGTFSSTVTLSGTAANIALGSNYISNGGTDAGISLDASNNATISGDLTVSGGDVSSTRINKVTITAPATGSTLTIADGKTLTANNSLTLAGTDSTTMTFPAASTTVAGLGTTQTFTGVNTFSPTARTSGAASYFTVTTPADTNQTLSTEAIGANFTAATRQWATGALTLQRERVFAAPTYGFVGASTLTEAVNVDIAAPVAGTNATITNSWALRSAAAKFTGAVRVEGAATFTGNVTLGDADTDTITATSQFVTGTQLKSAKSAGNTLNLSAYDVDGAAYTNLITLTANNSPGLNLNSTADMTLQVGATTKLTLGASAITTAASVTSLAFNAGNPSLNIGTGALTAGTGAFGGGNIASAYADANDAYFGTTAGTNSGVTIAGGSAGKTIIAFATGSDTSEGGSSNRGKIWYDGATDKFNFSYGGGLFASPQMTLGSTGLSVTGAVTGDSFKKGIAGNFIIGGGSGGSTYIDAGTSGAIYFRPNNSTLAATLDSSGLSVTGIVTPEADNTRTLGTGALRWSVVYAGTGTINTSDAREKTPVRALTANEINASKQLSKEIGAYRWLSAVEKKGDDAREHIGLTVQRAIEIMEANNLAPMAYGFICYDQWDEVLDAEGNVTQVAGDRYSFRMDELNLFIASGLEARLSALEAA